MPGPLRKSKLVPWTLQLLPVWNFQVQKFVVPHHSYTPKETELASNPRAVYSLHAKHFDEFVRGQYAEDGGFLVRPKEVAFIGKSNVGKSSLINAVCQDRLCRVSKHAGCTKSVNIFPLNFNQFKIVDLPGYGFGGGSLEQNSRFQKLIRRYLSESSRLSAVFWCINPSHGLNENDRLFLHFAANLQLPIHLVFTKADEMEQLMLFERVKAVCQAVRPFARTFSPEVNITSTKTQFGLPQLRMAIKQALLESSPRSITRKAGRIGYLLDAPPTSDEAATYRLLVQADNHSQSKQNLLEMKGTRDSNN